MIVIVTRKEITMVARNTSELVDALNQEDEESLKILFSKSTIANMKQLRKNSLTNESIYTRTRRLIRYYYKNFINSKLPIFLCIIIYFLICGTGNLITGIIWFKYHNSPTDTHQEANENVSNFENNTYINLDLNQTMLQPAFEEEIREHEELNIFSVLKNLKANEVSIRQFNIKC